MIAPEQTQRFQRMETAAPILAARFQSLSQAHAYFQRAGGLRSISVSGVLDNGSIEATFQGVRIKFEPLLIFGNDRSPRTRVLCLQCHCSYGHPVQDVIGSFTYAESGETDLNPDLDGNFPRMDTDAPGIVLHFLDAVFHANRVI